MKKPNFFIVGGARCGTTAMYTYLKQHPDIFMPDKKEPFFFGSDLALDQDRPNLDWGWYLSLFESVKNEKRIGEGSTTYLYSCNAAAEIKEFNDRASIIIMIRNPLEMLYSIHYFRLSRRLEIEQNFEAAIYGTNDRAVLYRAEIEQKIGRKLPDYLDYPRFSEQIKRYCDVFEKEKIHVIVYDDFIDATETVYQDVLGFLEVDNSFCPNFEIINANKRARSKMIQNFMKRLRQLPQKEKLLHYSLVRRLKESINHYNTIPYKKSEINFELKKRLQDEYADDVAKLSEMLGRDLTHWVGR